MLRLIAWASLIVAVDKLRFAKAGERFYTVAGRGTAQPPDQATIQGDHLTRSTSGRMEGFMHDSQRYRDMAAKCLRAVQETYQPHYRKLQLSMAVSWHSLARQDEAMDDLLASWDMAGPVEPERHAA
jgi:hypothetical protein